MTREEAKTWLDRLYMKADITDEYGDMEDTQPYEEAIDMAIKALEQEPCEDTISRQAAIDAVNVSNLHRGIVSALQEIIRELPSAQPEIIHCENCKHWKNNHLCECLSRYGTFDTPKDFFCGYGKAK